MLELIDIVAGYNEKQPILNGLSLQLREGEKLAILGQNGAGKSTVGKLIMGLLPYAKGEVRWKGENLLLQTPHTRIQKGIGYCMQGGRVFPHLTLNENLQVASLSLPTEQRKKVIASLVSHFDLLQNTKRHNLQAANLSGGERHQLALAMVLVGTPNLKLLIADESSAGLSPANGERMFEILSALHKSLGFSLLMIEQNVEKAKNFCDRYFTISTNFVQ